MSKLFNAKSTLSFDKAPVQKKKKSQEKLGFVTRAKRLSRNYRLRVETIEALNDLKNIVNKKCKLDITATDIIELLILDASDGNADRIIHIINTK